MFAPQIFAWETATWEAGCAEARSYVDGLGRPIDEGILETVVALNLLGFRSTASCEGHLEHGKPFPWIDFELEGTVPEGFAESEAEAGREDLSPEAKEAACDRLLALMAAYHHKDHLYTRLNALLEVFYEQRNDVPYEERIMLDCRQPGWYRLLPASGFDARIWPESERAERLICCQAEMHDLTHYLKTVWEARRGLSHGWLLSPVLPVG
jgi:hypothetical protein